MPEFLAAVQNESRLVDVENAGKLYLCMTPIGSLDDITLRVLKTLEEVDLIAAEDTRHSIKLLNHFEIKTPVTNCHGFSKVEKAKCLVEQMRQGVSTALVTDAGTPGISGPGEELVRQCYEAGIEATSMPGPTACVTTLTLSGLSTRRFCFEAFLPTDEEDRQWILEELKWETRTIIVYEAPHRLVEMLGGLLEALGNQSITACRGLTRKYEETYRATFEGALKLYEMQEPKGEYVVIVEGKQITDTQDEQVESWEEMPMEEHMATYESRGIERKEAMRLMTKGRGISKRDVYQYLMNRKESQGLKFV